LYQPLYVVQGIGAGADGNAVVLLPLLLPQGHLASTGESVLWHLITQLAYALLTPVLLLLLPQSHLASPRVSVL
jgi:hypothetical protein